MDHNGEDENVEEVVVVKKKKSRLGLDGLKWGSLGEVTNVPAASKEEKAKEKDKHRSTENLKVKGDDSQRWWSIGRSRKDSKEKGKEKENKEQLAPSRATCKIHTPVLRSFADVLALTSQLLNLCERGSIPLAPASLCPVRNVKGRERCHP